MTTTAGPLAPHVKTSTSVIALKVTIWGQKGIPLEDQRLIFVGKQLEDDTTISFYNITKEKAVMCVPSGPKGGAKRARRDEAGTISGAMDMMEALCRVGAPLLGGALLEQLSLEASNLTGCALALGGTALLYEVAPAEHRRAIANHGLRPAPPPKAKAA